MQAVVSLGLVLLGSAAVVEALLHFPDPADETPGAEIFPIMIGVCLIAAAGATGIQGLKSWRIAAWAGNGAALKPVALFAALSFAYVLTLPWLGFEIGTPALLAGAFVFLGERRPIVMAAVAAGITIEISLLFRLYFEVVLPLPWFVE